MVTGVYELYEEADLTWGLPISDRVYSRTFAVHCDTKRDGPLTAALAVARHGSTWEHGDDKDGFARLKSKKVSYKAGSAEPWIWIVACEYDTKVEEKEEEEEKQKQNKKAT